jgi:hypothetical protein
MFIGYIYIIVSAYTDLQNLIKIGLTIHPVHRMRQYDVGDAPGVGLEKRYYGLWRTSAKSKAELHAIEKEVHDFFMSYRQPRENGRSSEWFKLEAGAAAEFIESLPGILERIPEDDIAKIQTKSKKPVTKEEREEMREEKEFMDEQADALAKAEAEADAKADAKAEAEAEPPALSLRERFLLIILFKRAFRMNQAELWDTFSEICDSPVPLKYKGIIQWPTGTGKTYALLMLFVISAERCKRAGTVFRGLLVAPQNNIFNTIMKDIHLLSHFGITVYEGHNANLSSLNLPHDVPLIVTATHAGLTNDEMLAMLPPMTHVHYDEVHRIGGDHFFTLLKHYLEVWNTEFLTGTSATPKTSDPAQHHKIAELFGDPYNILHKCDIDTAIEAGWIAKPRFQIAVVPKNLDRHSIIRQFLQSTRNNIISKQEAGLWSKEGGKCIAYLPRIEEVRYAFHIAAEEFPNEWKSYLAVEDGPLLAANKDDRFLEDKANGIPRILFACEKYREGSDIKGLEMTCVLMGNKIAANILIQIIGRALRLDHVGKEGWCLIFRPSDEGTTEDDVMDNILLEIAETLGRNEILGDPKEIRKMVEAFIGSTTMNEKSFSIEETVSRIQALYERKAWSGRNQKERYEVICRLNKGMSLTSRQEYQDRSSEHLNYIEDPKTYFKAWWVSWYHFLGIDTSAFPQTKADWVRMCKDMGIKSWSEYKQKNSPSLPANPGEMYEDYTNPDSEFGVEEDIVW